MNNIEMADQLDYEPENKETFDEAEGGASTELTSDMVEELIKPEVEKVSMEEELPIPQPTRAAGDTSKAAQSNKISPVDMLKKLEMIEAELKSLKSDRAKDLARLATLEKKEERRAARKTKRDRNNSTNISEKEKVLLQTEVYMILVVLLKHQGYIRIPDEAAEPYRNLDR